MSTANIYILKEILPKHRFWAVFICIFDRNRLKYTDMNNNENKSLSKKKKNEMPQLSILNHPSASYTFKPEFAPMSNSIYYYIASNFFQMLGIDIITKDNFHHIIDSFRAYRSLMRNLNLVELVDSMNYALDYLAEYLPVEPEVRYLYRDKDYRKPRIEFYFSGKENDIDEIPNTVKDEGASFLSHYLEDSLCENFYSNKSTLTDKTQATIQVEVINSPTVYETNAETIPPTQEPQETTANEISKVEPQGVQNENISTKSAQNIEQQSVSNETNETNADCKFQHVKSDIQNMIQKIKKQG